MQRLWIRFRELDKEFSQAQEVADLRWELNKLSPEGVEVPNISKLPDAMPCPDYIYQPHGLECNSFPALQKTASSNICLALALKGPTLQFQESSCARMFHALNISKFKASVVCAVVPPFRLGHRSGETLDRTGCLRRSTTNLQRKKPCLAYASSRAQV